jgi:hypothetical protein
VRTTLVLVLISIIAGVGIGGGLGYQTYGQPENELGPYSLSREVSEEEVDGFWGGGKESTGVPRLEVVGGNTFNFGVMRRNATEKHQFVVKNVGEGELNLVVAGSTCKCTVGSLEKSGLQAGESTVVDLEWSAKTNDRTFSQSATLKTNDPSQGEVALVVEGNVVDMVAAEPVTWNLGDIATAAPIELKATLYNYAQEPMELVQLRWMDEAFHGRSDIQFERRAIEAQRDGIHTAASEAFDVRIAVAPGSPQGLLQQTLRIDYRSQGETENHPPLEMTLTGRIVGTLSVMGGPKLVQTSAGSHYVDLGTVVPGGTRSERIHVLVRGPLKDVATLRVGGIDPAEVLEASLGEPTERGSIKVYPLVVRIKETAPEMERSGITAEDYGVITLESDHPEVAPMRIGVVFRVGKL